MIPPRLLEIEQDLRRAVAGERYEEAERLIVRFCESAAAEAIALPAGSPERRGVLNQVKQLFEWTGRMLATARASCAGELRRFARLNRYLDRPDSTRPGVRLQG